MQAALGKIDIAVNCLSRPFICGHYSRHTVAQTPEALIACCVMSPLNIANHETSNLHCMLVVALVVRGSPLPSSLISLRNLSATLKIRPEHVVHDYLLANLIRTLPEIVRRFAT